MSVAMWCDAENHAFKGGEPGSQSFDGRQVGPDGIERNTRVDVCAEHAMRNVLGNTTKELGS